ncbi:hypothetical protein [Synechococcus sp. CS-1332]|uniref:hypothetical protein n=1 Tax=Synechococcus sp. CS-1332 TaxID=2847972 RepID=UPI00223BA268|nr:hypothetical protein [Synechococcus sp. CS-1332]
MVTPPFADLAMLTHSSRCVGSLSDLFDGRVNCDPYGRLFTYPPMALWMFSALGLSSASLGWVGIALGAAVALLTGTFFFTLIPSAAVAGILLALTYLSLPFQLALERANNDLIVFLLLALLALALSSQRPRLAVAAAPLAFLSVATKILPLFGLIATQWLPAGLRSKAQLPVRNLRWGLLGGVAGLSLVLPWLGPILRNSPAPSGGILSHGLMDNQVYLDKLVNLSGAHSRVLLFGCLGIKLLFLLMGFVGAWRQEMRHRLHSFLASQANRLDGRLIAVTISLFSGTWVGSYLFTKSYDYKFIFLVPILGLTGALLSRGATGAGQRAWISLILVPILAAWFIPYLAISFGKSMGVSLELVNDFVLIPVLAGAVLATLIGLRSALRAIP